MSAIRNVGELASPYFLLEVWARRSQITIDPETYATLKRKARSLVRDARAFESRGEEPDDDWRARRRDLLGLDRLLERTIELEDGTNCSVGVWRNGGGVDALVVRDLAGFGDPDERSDDAPDPPATMFELALDAYDGEADWGLLLAGLEARVYRRSSGISQQYLALELDSLVELDDESAWKAFAGIFRAAAFAPGEDGVPFIRRVIDESRRHASKLADDMRSDVVHAAESLIQGALDHPANRAFRAGVTRVMLQQLFEETLYYLYRVLFVLYAEARDVLPLSGAGPYAKSYSADHLIELARSESENADGTYYGDTLRRLFALLWQGPPELARALEIEPVGGELFEPAHTSLLDSLTIGDPAWRRALTAIALGAPNSGRRRMGRRSSFAELGVDQLGSIYEGLLTLEPFLAPGPRLVVRIDGERRVLEPGMEGSFRVEQHLNEGDFVLESASGRRKGTGSFYTPTEITNYLAEAAIGPLVEPILKTARENPSKAVSEILALRILDPAMGSGAFLVQAARVMGLALARARAAGGDGRVTPELVRRSERDVVRSCLYGVDYNRLAVALAKVSLWLETLEPGRPLSFLDAQLSRGDSLVGLGLPQRNGTKLLFELTVWPKDATKGLVTYLKKEAGELGEALVEQLKDERKTPRRDAQPFFPNLGPNALPDALTRAAAEREALPSRGTGEETLQLELEAQTTFSRLEEESESLRNRLRAAADFWCAQWFSEGEDSVRDGDRVMLPVAPGDYDTILACLLSGGAIPERLRPQHDAARRVADKRRFFHWALEFPEVIVDRGGFDVVIGNPPWNTLSPDVKEFFSTYDPQTFRKGVPKDEQQQRKQTLREDPEIDAAWRAEARFLHELSAYSKPEAGHFTWFAEDAQLRKGDANVFRLFVERSFCLLRKYGRFGQVLPDSVYVSSPATGVRKHLLSEGRLECLYVFENRKKIFPIDSRIKVVLLVAQRGAGPTEWFRAKFFVGKDAAGCERAVGLEELPGVLAELGHKSPELAVADIKALAPATWSFPELQTALDAEIAAHCVATVPALNLDERGWGLKYCAELHADRDAWRFKDEEFLRRRGARREGLRWIDPEGFEWWPLVEGALFYHLEFPAEGREPTKWVSGLEVAAIEGRKNTDGSSVMEHYRVAWRDVARSVDERSAIATVLPPRTAAKHTSPTTWGASIPPEKLLSLAALISSFVFDYLVRFVGKTHLTHAVLNSIPAPSPVKIASLASVIVESLRPPAEYAALARALGLAETKEGQSLWDRGELRATIDAHVARSYELKLNHFCAVLSTFPNTDTVQPMLPGEPKSFVTRDLALLAYCRQSGIEPVDIVGILRDAGVELPMPRDEFRRLDHRVARYRELGAVPYRPTPRGGRVPTDPELIAQIRELLTTDSQSAADIAEALYEEVSTAHSVLEMLVRDREAFAEGRGNRRRYYVVEEGE
ncbi:MAG: hypothetical protein A2133_12150 [Actinobacteria bacterium RBG_16_64_13]|nr:MAG: hypothetical protein A2133_12150 [Actinobacteria bacterium RBG_16_64_13]